MVYEYHIKQNGRTSLSQALKENYDSSKYSQEILDYLDKNMEEIIRVLYEIEKCILTEGIVPELLKHKLKNLKELNTVYKESLSVPNTRTIDFPNDFIGEYKELYRRVLVLIEKIKFQLYKYNDGELYSKELKDKLNKLHLLEEHYSLILD